ncbi:16S rRNA processing protein RimM [Marininema mesophilum]|uniref:Ribosome maturation factor RimM n=1 Tax=Marininema mesophilum TaxID=1048340 RepID=A0A1H2Q0F1_9BACL|nr:ribosome maturation factor RimM [Marininema mesophilum]SDW00625.1 16S rRNA processing protein RimM [Marininema mesophilum]
MSEPDWLTVGHIAGTHGVRGEVRVVSRTDYPELRFVPKAKLMLSHPQLKENLVLTVESVRTHQKWYLIRFQEWPDLTAAEPFKGGTLMVDRSQGVEEEDGFYHFEIIGCEVVTTEGEYLGTITNILQPGANDVWVVRSPKGKELLIPYIDDVVKDVDVTTKRVTIQWMEGLG